MTNPLRKMVSKKKKRYTADGFNLDLSYITKNIIAMGFPAERIEGYWRNRKDDVVRLLESKHQNHYKIYNLCSEKVYDRNNFKGRVAEYLFDDHNPPNIELIFKFCDDVHAWLTEDSNNVAAVHCKAGKGRTGTMICCYMLYSRLFRTAAEALTCYSEERTHDLKGVTIPSQRRYVEYFESLLNMCSTNESGFSPSSGIKIYNPPVLHITELIMRPAPILNGGQGSLEFCVIRSDHRSQKGPLHIQGSQSGHSSIHVKLENCMPLVGDVKVEVYNRPNSLVGKKKLFYFWFNTFFVQHGVNSIREVTSENGDTTYWLEFDKLHLDKVKPFKQFLGFHEQCFSSQFIFDVKLQYKI